MKMNKIMATLAACAVSATALVCNAVSANAADTVATAYLIGQIGGETCWEANEVNASSKAATIDGNGKYEVEWVVTGGTDTVQFLAVVMTPPAGADGFTTDQFPNLGVSVDSVYIDGTKVANYTTGANSINTAHYEKGAGVTRIYLRDDWTANKVADLPSATNITQSVKVVFNVSGLDNDGNSNVSEGGATTTTTTAAGGVTTTTKAAGATTTAASAGSSNTGDAGVGVIVAGLAIAGAAAFVTKKKN